MIDHRHGGKRLAHAPATRRMLAVAGLLAVLLPVGAARAQDAGEGFLFHVPRGSVGVHAGFDHAIAGSDLFSYTTSQLTVNRGDFSSLIFGVDGAVRLSPRLDLDVGLSYAGESTPSESREFIDANNQPIRQTTSFRRVPLSASLKWYLTPRGRAIGQFAWVPNKHSFFVGAGAGAMWYRFRQEGDFVDPSTLNIFTDALTSSGWTPELHGLAGVEYSLSPRFALTGEARYTWATGSPGQDFGGFDRIDLSGVSATAGIAVRF